MQYIPIVYTSAILAWLCYKKYWGWFNLTLLTWLQVATISAGLLPSVLGFRWAVWFYWAHFYLFVGSVWFLSRSMRAVPEQKGVYQLQHPSKQVAASSFLALVALSGMVQHLAYLVLLLLFCWYYPEGSSGILLVRLLQFYALNPLNWFLIHGCLMMVFFLHRCWVSRQKANVFTWAQLQGGFLLALIWQFAYVSGLDVSLWRILQYYWFIGGM